MKHLLFFSLLISSSSFAIDFNKVTGTFAETDKEIVNEENNDLAYGSFAPQEQVSGTRAPASVTDESRTSSINEVTGTFEYQND